MVTACSTTADVNGHAGGGINFAPSSTGGGTIIDCVFSDNSCPASGTSAGADGGAISISSSGNVLIKDCTFEDNSAAADGGAVEVSPNDSATVQIEDSTFFRNSAVCRGGGFYGYGDQNVDIINCTFVENAATYYVIHSSGYGGAIYAQQGDVDLYNCTVVNNSAAGKGGGLYSSASASHHSLYSSIFGYNTAIYGDTDVHLEGDGSINYCIYSGAPADNNNIDATPEVSQTLADNGGPTLTLMIDNPGNCIDAGANPLSLSYDQRGPGYVRTSGGITDIGAVEWIPEPGLLGFIAFGLLALIRKNR